MDIDKLKAKRRAAIDANDFKQRKKGKRQYRRLLKKFKSNYKKGYSGVGFDNTRYYTITEIENMLTADLENAFYIDAKTTNTFSKYDWYVEFKLN